MRVKQIELVGFKSFSDKTVLRLHDGVTCIVGPNGCGKSNVVDAFKWVLGEQSVKSLRGEKMEEVIFQGSSTVKQKGMAEVTMQIFFPGKQPSENNNGSTPETSVSGDEASVSRRLYRSGESEYLLNKSQCRLKDIKDIFLDTGLDVKSYSILDQGRVTEIINAKPQDRRFLIEEVAGVMKYKARKTEALSKLESSKQNLQRINDIVYEVKRQINSLDRQVKKAERYKRLNSELSCIELRIGKREYMRLSGVVQEFLVEIEKLKEVDLLKRSALSTLENQLEARRLELAGKEKLLAELENSLYGKERELSESEKHVAILKTAIDNRRADIARLSAQQSDFDKKNEDLITKLGSFDADISAFSSCMSGLTGELAEKRESLLSIELSIGDKESRLEEKRKELFRVSEVVSQKRNELHKLQSSFETLRYRESASAKDFEAVRDGIAASEESITAESERITAFRHRLSAVQSGKDALKVETENLTGVIESKKDLLASEREALASNMARVGSLKELAFDKSLMDVLTEAVAAAGRPALAGEGTSGLSADCPVLSDIISTEKEYEKAIEAALSERINSILLKKIDDILAATAVIRERNLARTALLYTGFSFEHSAQDSEGPFDGIIGKASDFISFENKELQVPAGRILENTLIAKDLQSAIEFRNQKTSRQYALVTLEGEVIDRDGVILAGQGKDVLKRKREIKELTSAVLKQQSLISMLENDLTVATSTLSEKNVLLTNAGSTLVAVEKELTVAEHSMKSLLEEAERKQRKISFLNSEIATINGEKESLGTLIAAKSEEIGFSEKERDSVNETIAALQDSVGSVRTEYEAARSEVTDLQLAITSRREKMESLQREKASIAGALKDLGLSREAAFRESDEAAQRLSTASFELQGYEEVIKTLVVGADVLRRERAAQKETIDTESQALITENNSLRNIRFEIDALSSQLAGVNAKAIENRLMSENVESSIAHKYGIAIKDVEIETEGFDPAEDEEQVNQLNEKIRDLGPVNLGTIEEYEELKNRYDFLTKQQQDLTLSIAELEEAISRINASTRRKLREAYDALRAKFSEVFQTLFGGGRADIVLTDEDNILESGIEIIAQPPGKKLQNLNLLSGGEKALTSLSLLFAGFLIKPSPLCILDEVDAPLDESNTVRFAQTIKGLSKDTQFIIITHNRATMEVADYLYGITMEEPGVSKAISLQFAEIENKQ
ncbi:MAG TPA: chromosome segregation protein SMC [Dissulfurispiraceae bacterium]|nr:chromosome segregation protein SMC [Dissulfurispiraceae bacterium]